MSTEKTLSLLTAAIASVVSIAGLLLKGSAGEDLTTMMAVGGGLVAITALTVFFIYYNEEVTTDTQRMVSDLELLRLFEQQPGGLLSAEMIAEKTGLNKTAAWTRLSALATGGLLNAGTNPMGTKYFYELSAPLEEVPGLKLSEEPFLTIEDLQEIFIAYEYKVSPQDLMVSTGLPWKMLSREMQYFRKQGVVDVAYINRPGDSNKQYILMEKYHRSEGLDLNSRTRINEEVKQVLYDEQFLV